MKKKFISAIMALTMVVTGLGLPVFGENYEYRNDTDYYDVDDSLSLDEADDVYDIADKEDSAHSDEGTITPTPTQKTEQTSKSPSDATPSPKADVSPASSEIKLMSGETVIDLSSSNYEITSSGSYIVDGSATKSIIVKNGVTADLTLDSVTITTANAAPIKVESGAQLNLHLKGTSTLTSSTKYYSGIAVYAESLTNYGTLIIDGDGTLNVKSQGIHGAGIGTNRMGTDGSSGINGKIIINSGIINATGGTNGAGIGMPNYLYTSLTGCSIEINGGYITAVGGNSAAGIGGGKNGYIQDITINGGYIKATSNGTGIQYGIGPGQGAGFATAGEINIKGGSINADIEEEKSVVTDGDGLKLTKKILKLPSDLIKKEFTFNGWTGYTDENAQIYLYLTDNYLSDPESAEIVIVNCNGKVYMVNAAESDTFTEYSGGACTCTEEDTSITLDIPSEASINVLDTEARIKLNTIFHAADDCTYPIHKLTTTYAVTLNGAPVTTDKALIQDGYLIIKKAANGETLHVVVNATLDGKDFTYTASKDIDVIVSTDLKFDLSQGNIEIKNDTSPNKIKIIHGSTTYTAIDKSQTITITSKKQTENHITVSGIDEANVVFENVNISTTDTSVGPINIGDGTTLNLILKGNNNVEAQLTSAIKGYLLSSKLNISGSGSLNITSGNGAGIGNINTLTVNGGTIIATGGNGGAGIGGGRDGAGIDVIINDGRVYAYGDKVQDDGKAAGIGGGSGSSAGTGGNFVINGGVVVAKGGGAPLASGGAGIGYGGRPTKPGTIVINGGSVDAQLAKRPTSEGKNQYKVAVSIEGILGKTDVSYSIDDGELIPSGTDADSKMYLYLTTGKHWIRVYKDGKTYYRYLSIKATDTNNEAYCISDPIAKLTKFAIAGQIGDTVIDEEASPNPTVKVVVPSNIDFNRIMPQVKYDGAEANPVQLTFTLNDSTGEYTATYTITSDKKENREYNIILTPQTQISDGPDVYDISKGDVVITEEYIRYGGAYYRINATDGYIITGTTDEYLLTIDEAENNLPPIILKDLTINKNNGSGIIAYVGADISVEGICSITSTTESAINVNNGYGNSDLKFNISGNGRLNISSAGSSAINLDNNTMMTITGVTTTIDGSTNAISGTGKFITDSDTVMHIVNVDDSQVKPTTSDGTRLYQLTAEIDADTKNNTTCIYNDKEYYVGNDAILYLMVPNGEYNMDVTYDSQLYTGGTTINNASVTFTLYTVKVFNVEYQSAPMSFQGGNLDFIVTGTLVANNVKIRLEPDEGGDAIVSTVCDVDGQNVATLVLPKNERHDKSISYTAYYVINGEKIQLPKKVVVSFNNTVCRITGFEIPNQVGATSITETEDYNSIKIEMPYDHEFADYQYYTASKIEFIGRGVEPDDKTPTQFTLDTNGYMRATYTVTAMDNKTKSEYRVRLVKHPTPIITSLSFTNPKTSDGGKITVIARGSATNYIKYAEKENNRKVTIYGEGIDPVEATLRVENGVAIYEAEVTIPENDSYTDSAKHILKAKIGDIEQTGINESFATVTVPRRERTLTDITEFTIPNQLGETQILSNKITITMPYDADLSDILPNITLQDLNASYVPFDSQDFNSDIKYTVTAENGVDKKEYTVHVEKQAPPVAHSIEFTNPKYSGAGRVQVKINGDNLDNAFNAINVPPQIRVDGSLISGDTINSKITSGNAVKNDEGDYVATITVPQNDSKNPKVYNLVVVIGNTVQILNTDCNTHLTVPAKEATSKELTDIIIADGQSDLIRSDNKIYLYVPYNTDLIVKPEVHISGVSYSFVGDVILSGGKIDFNKVVKCTVTAQDDTTQTYEIQAMRSGEPRIDTVTFNKPTTFADTTINIDITGQFIPYLKLGVEKDKMVITAVPRDGGTALTGSITYANDVYGGKASAIIELPQNETSQDQIYDIKITINDIEQNIGINNVIVLPKKKSRKIVNFSVNGQVGSTQIDDENHTITFRMPYNTDLTSLKPSIIIDGDTIEVAQQISNADTNGFVTTAAQNFDKNVVQYIISSEDDENVVYNVTALRDGTPTISSVSVEGEPSTFKGSNIDVDVKGVFFYDFKVKAVCDDGTTVDDANIETHFDEKHEASATITLPKNEDMTKDKNYTLEFYLDDFDMPISYTPMKNVTVPRRKTRAITYFSVINQVGESDIQEKDIYAHIKYEADIRDVSLNKVIIDGDSYMPTTSQNYSTPVSFTVSAADDEDRDYTVHISRSGTPTLTDVTYIPPSDFNGGNVTVNLKGIFYNSVEVYAVPRVGGANINGTVKSFEEGKAVVVIPIPKNLDNVNSAFYDLEYIIDGVKTQYNGFSEISVPRRKTRQITSFTMPEVQEGETTIDQTTHSIYVNVPYNLDISAIEPIIEFDADKITPTGPQDFSDRNKQMQYKLSADGDEDIIYKVFVTRPGEDPYLKSMTLDKQAKETEYDGDNVYILLKAGVNLKQVEPVLDYQGTSYTPTGPQDFSNSKKEPVEYTLVNQYGVEHKYYVTIEKKSSSHKKKETTEADPTPTPAVTPEPTSAPTDTPTPKPGGNQALNKPYIFGYDDEGELFFRPDNSITRAEVSAILAQLDDEYDSGTVYSSVFTDVRDNAWYANYVNYAANKHYISGYDDNTCRPENMITRAEFASMLARYLKLTPVDGESKFTDMADYDWCIKEVNALCKSDIAKGCDSEMFMPYKNVTRAEVVAMINRAIGRSMTDELKQNLTNPFADVIESHWAYNDILLSSCEY